MHSIDDVNPSWADEVERGEGSNFPSTEFRDNGLKIVTEYRKDGEKKQKIVRTFKIEKRIVPKSIALRKTWAKFGHSQDDESGLNPATTTVAEDVYMQFITNKEDEKQEEESGMEKLKGLGDKNMVKCRHCQGDHWTTKCPFKDTVLAANTKSVDEKKGTLPGISNVDGGKSVGSKYVPPSLRDGAPKRSDNPNMPRRDDNAAIRINNLSDSTTESDLEELVRPFGPIQKLYLAKEKNTGHCKGFAYVHFKFRTDASKAIDTLNGYGYDHLILNVEWSKPPAHPN